MARPIHKKANLASVASVAAPAPQGKATPADDFVAELRAQFDAEWYVSYYGVVVSASSSELPEVVLQHYLNIGTRFCFSPSRAFDEVAYRLLNPDVESHIQAGKQLCAFEHYVLFGRKENRRAAPLMEVSRSSISHPMYSDVARVIRPYFDGAWYLKAHPEVAGMIDDGVTATPFLHYLTDGLQEGRSPNDWFDEPWYVAYYPDIGEAKQRGVIPCGFFHFLTSGKSEGRFVKPDTAREIEHKYPGLTRPVGLERLSDFEAKLSPPPCALVRKGPRRLNVLVPTLDKNIMFGGYIALMHFMASMQDRGWQIRVLIFEDGQLNLPLIRLQFAQNRRVIDMLAKAEILNLSVKKPVVDISPNDRFLAYSMWMAHQADALARRTGRRFAFFVQEYEPIFHSHDCWHALGASAYLKSHFAIFNSPLLRDYFRTRRYGVYAESVEVGETASIAFEHAISVKGSPSSEELDHPGDKRLLFYARPEAHAARNLFEIGIIALRRAIAEGTFGPEWQFDGVGSLGLDTRVDLGGGRYMHVQPKLELAEYSAALRRYDVGMSLMYAPHPSVVPFEMAASGVVTVTNVYENRDADALRAISTNLVPSMVSVEHLSEALRIAERRATDIPGRLAGAARSWVRDWSESFSDSVLDAIEKEFA